MRKAIVCLLFFPLAACGGSHSSSTSDGASTPSASDGANAPPAFPPSQSQTVTCKGLVPVTDGLRHKAFYALSGNEWTSSNCTSSYPYGQCTTVRLEPSGRYTITTTGTYAGPGPNAPLPRNDSGSWNFASSDGQRGIVCLDGETATAATTDGEVNLPSAMAFDLTPPVYGPSSSGGGLPGGALSLGALGTLVAGDTIEIPGTAELLPDVHVPEGFARIVGKTWRKASTFDPMTVPSTLVFDALGNLTETYEGATCSQNGPTTWDKDTLLRSTQPCSYPSFIVPSQVPDFIDDLFVFSNGVFRANALANARTEFVFDPYGHAVHVHGSFDGTLHAGVATTMDLTLSNVDPVLLRQLDSLTITIQPAKLSGGTQYITTGVAPTTLATRDYASLVLPAGQTHDDSITVTPPTAGDTFALTFEIAFHDATKDYKGTHTYIGAVLP